jgi:glycerate kinase
MENTLLKIAICPNAFRGSLSAVEAAQAIQRGLQSSSLKCETFLMPVADGGNGTLDVWCYAIHAEVVKTKAQNPLGKPINAEFGFSGKTAMVEMACASGIELLEPRQRNPLRTSTFGTGQLIRAAIEYGATRILVGVGGSGTVDGGAGCLQALDARLLDRNGQDIPPGGEHLNQLASIDADLLHRLLSDTSIQVLCDVDNPLLGERGAARVFAPQKGADAEAVEQLEENLAHFAGIVQRDIGVDIRNLPGTGAAGGLSAGLYGVAGAELVSGIETLIESTGYGQQFAKVGFDLVITGEGKLDEQTEGGKAPLGVAREAAKYSVPVIALAGAVTTSPEQLNRWGINAAWSITMRPCKLEDALHNANEWLAETATHIGNLLAINYSE